jgi:hypothetical protein
MAEEQFTKIANTGDLARSLVMPRLVINIPMPAGAAVPARAPQSQPVPQAEPVQPAAAQSR